MTDPDVPAWLADRFRERREWWEYELIAEANASGISWKRMWAGSIGLPVLKRLRFHDGSVDRRWMWMASEGWPGEEAAS